jgi:sporulation protein YlmC with PRC-barrel domain
MDSVPLSSLSDCEVMLADGALLWTLDNITLNPATGDLEYLCIDPSGREPGAFPRMENDQIVVPVDRVEPRQEYLLVRPPD